MDKQAVVVVGMGDDGCLGLSSRAFNRIRQSQILVGGSRLLEFFPDYPGEKIRLAKNPRQTLSDLLPRSGDTHITILASGDPLFYGIGSMVMQIFGTEHVGFIPHLSSIQLAFASCGLTWQDAHLESVHGRSMQGLIARLQNHSKIAVLTDQENSPRRIAQSLLEFNDLDWQAYVCENLGSTEQRVRSFDVEELAACDEISPLNVLILLRDAAWKAPAIIPFGDEDDFAKRIPLQGLITKKEVRVLSLAKLNIRLDSVIWDIGAGSGSVGIEAAKLASNGRVYSIECDPEAVGMCEQNRIAHRVDHLQVISGMAPAALAELEAPDAVFIGGSKGQLDAIIEHCFEKLKPGGRLVVNAITLENVSQAMLCFKSMMLSPDLCLLQVSRGKDLAGRYTRYEALNPIHIFTVEKSCRNEV